MDTPVPVIFSIVFVGIFVFAIYNIFDAFARARRAREMHGRAQHLAARGDTRRALELVREAKSLMPQGKNGHATAEYVDMATLAAMLEERLHQEVSRVAPPPPAPRAPAPPPRAAGPRTIRAVSAGSRVGEYVLEEKIGEGGFGHVWRAKHAVFHTSAAVKIPSQASEAHISGLSRLARIQRRFDDPRIVKILGAELEGETPHVVMELVEGADLRRLLEKEKRLAPSLALAIFDEVAAALATAHGAGVVHRDLKPENILVGRDGRVKVTDFELGSARAEAGGAALSTGLATGFATTGPAGVAGTLAYMAPEQLAGEAVDARADVYALGVILFEMLTGKRPQPNDHPSQLAPGIGPALDELFLRCYTRLEKRFPSARDALAAVKQARAEPAPQAKPAAEAPLA